MQERKDLWKYGRRPQLMPRRYAHKKRKEECRDWREVYLQATETGPKLKGKFSRIVRPWRMPRIPTSRRPLVTVPICWRRRKRQVSLWLSKEPAGLEDRLDSHIRRFLQMLVLFAVLLVDHEEWFCGLVDSLSRCRRANFCILFFCLSEIRSSRTPSWFNWMLNSFRSCCDVWMILQSNIVIFNNLLFCPPNFWQRLSILFVFVASFKYGFISSMIGLTSFLQHVLSFAVHSLPFRRSMFGTATVILFDIIAKNWKDVVVVLVELLSSLRRF